MKKTIKIEEETHNKLMLVKTMEKIDHHKNLKTIDEVINYLFEKYQGE